MLMLEYIIFFMEHFSLIVITGIFLAMASGALCIVLCFIGLLCCFDDDTRKSCFQPRNSIRTDLKESNPEAHISSLAGNNFISL